MPEYEILNCIYVVSSYRKTISVRLFCIRFFFLHNCPFTLVACVFVRGWSLAGCPFNASGGGRRVGVFSGHSAGVGGLLGVVIGVSVPQALSMLRRRRKQLRACTYSHTWAHTHTHTHLKIWLILFKLTQVSWFPRVTPPHPFPNNTHTHQLAPPLPFSPLLCWKEPIVRWLVTRHPIYQLPAPTITVTRHLLRENVAEESGES